MMLPATAPNTEEVMQQQLTSDAGIDIKVEQQIANRPT